MRTLAFALLLPATAQAAPWEGIWSVDPAWCAMADQIGEVDPSPISLSAETIRAYESECAVTTTQSVEGMNAWMLSASCTGEGATYDISRLVMLDGNAMWMWVGDSEPLAFERCPE